MDKEDKIREEYYEANLKSMFGKKFAAEAHNKKNPVTVASSEFLDYVFSYKIFDNIKRIRTADGEEVEIIEVEVTSGNFEK